MKEKEGLGIVRVVQDRKEVLEERGVHVKNPLSYELWLLTEDRGPEVLRCLRSNHTWQKFVPLSDGTRIE